MESLATLEEYVKSMINNRNKLELVVNYVELIIENNTYLNDTYIKFLINYYMSKPIEKIKNEVASRYPELLL